jgi:hypothetical protein
MENVEFSHLEQWFPFLQLFSLQCREHHIQATHHQPPCKTARGTEAQEGRDACSPANCHHSLRAGCTSQREDISSRLQTNSPGRHSTRALTVAPGASAYPGSASGRNTLLGNVQEGVWSSSGLTWNPEKLAHGLGLQMKNVLKTFLTK